MFLPSDRFRSHRCQPGQDIRLFHVYDNLSQTPYQPGYDIESGDPNTYLINPQHLITYVKMGQHLDWQNREPTNFISFYDNPCHALTEARRRMQQRYVPNQGTNTYRSPESVRIAVVSARRLDNSNAFYFSTSDLIAMLQIPSNHNLRPSLTQGEWFVMDFVPEAALLGDYSPQHFSVMQWNN